MTLRRLYDAGDVELLVTVDRSHVEVAQRFNRHGRWSAPLRCQGIEDDALGDDITDRLAAYDPDTSPGDVPGAALAEINRLRDALTAQAEMAAQAIEVALHYEGWFGDECRCGADDCPIVEWNK